MAVGWCVMMPVEAGNRRVWSAPLRDRAGMLTAAGVRLVRRVRAVLPRPDGRSGDELAARPHTAAEAPDSIGQGERERILWEARVHGMVAIQLSEVMQGNVGRREDLRQKLIRQGDGDDPSAAWLRSRIEELDQLIPQQVATVDWHLRESRRLRRRIGAE